MRNNSPSSLNESDSDNSESNLDILGVHPDSVSGTKGTGRPIECKWIDCGKSFNVLDDLAAHVTSLHANSGPGGLFFCGWNGCNRGNRGFNARYKMLVHVRTHTNEKPHHCLQCAKSFSRAENLKIHARSHTGERPYVCPVPGCGKAYSNSSDRFKHTRTHSVDKPYMCKVPGCRKRYTDPSSLRKHVKTYEHHSTNQPMEDNTFRVLPTVLKLQEEMQHEQIVPQAECIPQPSLQKKKFIDSSNLHYYNLENDEDVSFRMLRSWISTEHLKWYHDENDEYWNGCYYHPKEQDVPLDLSVHK